MRYDGLEPASANASRAAKGASAKRDTKPEIQLRQALRAIGVRGYRVDVATLPGRPDLVFTRLKLVVFCDGDFWHGRDLEARVERLARGHNAPYWVEKIRGNVVRDRRQEDELRAQGWTVLRFWERDIRDSRDVIAAEIQRAIQAGRDASS